MADDRRILVVATKGAGSNDERRILELLGDFDTSAYAFDRANKRANLVPLLRRIHRERPNLVVMEGTAIVGGLALLLGRALFGVPFVVSSGDAVGPFLGGTRPVLRVPGWAYEWLLYRFGAGFIGWTPYLVGRALTLGAPRGVTAAGFTQEPEMPLSRREVRAELGVPGDALVFGIVGSLDWNDHYGYCYGLELVLAAREVERRDVAVVVVGGGSGLERLRRLAGDQLGRRVFIPGPVPQEHVASYLAAMDVGSLPQSLDQVGMFRYTTKITEYVTARLPIVTGRLPLAYDVTDEWSWRLPGSAPWDPQFVAALAQLIDSVSPEQVERRRDAIPAAPLLFDRADQRRRVARFIEDLLEDLRRAST